MLIKLYHFTPVENIQNIWTSGAINPSAMAVAPNQMGSAVSLTDSSDPSGHGLTEGLPFIGVPPPTLATTTAGSQKITRDARGIRIALQIDDSDSNLIKASKFYASNPEMMIGLEIAAAYPHQVEPSDIELITTFNALNSKKTIGKGSTWWYYFGSIPTSLAVDVEERLPWGAYQTIFHKLP